MMQMQMLMQSRRSTNLQITEGCCEVLPEVQSSTDLLHRSATVMRFGPSSAS